MVNPIEYRGYRITRGRSYQDWRVDFPGRSRWGTLAECRADVDAFIIGMLPAPKRGMQ